MAKGGCGYWPFGTDALIVFTTDMATMGHSTSESTSGVRSHRFLLNNQECATVPTWSVNYRCFINRTSKLIRLSCCSRKMMVASKRHKDLYWFRPEPYVQS